MHGSYWPIPALDSHPRRASVSGVTYIRRDRSAPPAVHALAALFSREPGGVRGTTLARTAFRNRHPHASPLDTHPGQATCSATIPEEAAVARHRAASSTGGVDGPTRRPASHSRPPRC